MWSSSSSSENENEEIIQIRRRRVFRPRINSAFRSLFEFNERFRMTSVQMEQLRMDIGHMLLHPTDRSQALSTKMQICIALHWLGNGGQYHVISDAHMGSVKQVSADVLEMLCMQLTKSNFLNVLDGLKIF